MTTEHQTTPEEEAYGRLVEEARVVFSAAAGTVLSEAEGVSYGDNLVRNYASQPEDYEEAMDKMRLAATELTDRDQELLARLWRAALAAAASIDPYDRTPVAYYKADQEDFHWFYRTLSGMVEEILQEKKIAEQREIAMREPDPEDFEDIPF